MNCLLCNKETTNPKFCCKSHAATYNNKIYHKRSPIKRYCSCGKSFYPTNNSSRRLCNDCQQYRNTSTKYKNMTIKEYNDKSSVKHKHPSWKNSHIRSFNRQWNKDLHKVCEHCGYDKHVELCHIKPVSSFPETAMVSEVNDLTNLIALCPNCHWEFDHP